MQYDRVYRIACRTHFDAQRCVDHTGSKRSSATDRSQSDSFEIICLAILCSKQYGSGMHVNVVRQTLRTAVDQSQRTAAAALARQSRPCETSAEVERLYHRGMADFACKPRSCYRAECGLAPVICKYPAGIYRPACSSGRRVCLAWAAL